MRGCLRQVAAASNDQVHPSELDLVNWRLLCREGGDLIRGDHGVLALLLGTNASRSSRLRARVVDTSCVSLTTRSNSLAGLVGLVWIGRNGDIPDSNSTVTRARNEDRCLDAE